MSIEDTRQFYKIFECISSTDKEVRPCYRVGQSIFKKRYGDSITESDKLLFTKVDLGQLTRVIAITDLTVTFSWESDSSG